jgi:hypothetical protein
MTRRETRVPIRAKFATHCVSAIACLLLFVLAAFGQGELGLPIPQKKFWTFEPIFCIP